MAGEAYQLDWSHEIVLIAQVAAAAAFRDRIEALAAELREARRLRKSSGKPRPLGWRGGCCTAQGGVAARVGCAEW